MRTKDNQFEVCEKIFDMEIENDPRSRAPFAINEMKIEEMIRQNGDKEVFRFVEGYNEKYLLNARGVLYRYDARMKKYVRMRPTLEKDGSLHVKLNNGDGKRKTSRIATLMKHTFPELITFDLEEAREDRTKAKILAANKMIKGEALIKCYNEITGVNNYYPTIHKASIMENIDEETIRRILNRDIDCLGGKYFYYN